MQKPNYYEVQLLIASYYIDAFPKRPVSDIQELWDYAHEKVDYTELCSDKAFKNLVLDFSYYMRRKIENEANTTFSHVWPQFNLTSHKDVAFNLENKMQKPSYTETQILIASFYIDAFPNRPTSDIQDLWDYAHEYTDYSQLNNEEAFKNLILEFVSFSFYHSNDEYIAYTKQCSK